MKDEDLRDLVIQHDKHMDVLATSVEQLAQSVATTAKKLDDVIEVISTQNVLIERMNNLDNNLKESLQSIM